MTEEPKKTNLMEVLLRGGLAVALVGNGIQAWQNWELQQANIQVAKVSEFKQSGSELDRAIISAYNALAAGKISSEDRKKIDDSFTEHALKTEEKREFLGAAETDQYLEALNGLRREVDAAENARGAGPRIEALAKVIKLRRQISEDALGT